jgi:PAS domain S-box-containing protein
LGSEIGIPPDQAQNIVNALKRVLETGEELEIEQTFSLPSGPKYFLTRIVVERDEDGRVESLLAITRDITELKWAEELLRESEEKYRMLVEHANEMIYVAQDGMLRLVNPMASRMTGYSEQELTSLPLFTFIHPDDRAMVLERYQKRISGVSLISRYTFRLMPKEGNFKWVELSAVRIHWEGRPATLNLLTDINDRKRSEDALSRVNRKLHLLSRMTCEDLQNQMFVLRSYFEFAVRLAEDARQQDFLKKYLLTLQQMDEQIAFTKDYQDLGTKSPEWQNVRQVFLYAVSHLQLGTFKHDIRTGDLEVFADPLFERALQRMVEHSLRPESRVDRIAIWHRETPEGVVIMYEDNGRSISGEDKEKIFERDNVIAQDRRLFFVREILDITAITIKETSEPGKGTRFEIAVQKDCYQIKTR